MKFPKVFPIQSLQLTRELTEHSQHNAYILIYYIPDWITNIEFVFAVYFCFDKREHKWPITEQLFSLFLIQMILCCPLCSNTFIVVYLIYLIYFFLKCCWNRAVLSLSAPLTIQLNKTYSSCFILSFLLHIAFMASFSLSKLLFTFVSCLCHILLSIFLRIKNHNKHYILVGLCNMTK